MSSPVSSDVLQCPQETEPPKPLPNWDLAKVLYSQGLQHATIASQAHVSLVALRKRIERHGWSHLRTSLTKAMSVQLAKQGGNCTDLARSLVEASDLVRGRLSGALTRASEGLDTVRPPKSLKSRRELAETVKAITDPAKTVFGWEDKAAGTAINLVLLQQAEAVQSEPGSPAIDIPSQVAQIQDVATQDGK